MFYDEKKDELIIRVPEKFKTDLTVCLQMNPPDFPFRYNLDYFLYIASKIVDLQSYKKLPAKT